MVTSMEFLWGAAGFILGGLAVWLWAGVRVRVAEGLLAETKQRLVEAEEDLRLTREQLDVERTARTRAETLLAESQKKIEEERKFLDEAAQKLADSFRSLAGRPCGRIIRYSWTLPARTWRRLWRGPGETWDRGGRR